MTYIGVHNSQPVSILQHPFLHSHDETVTNKVGIVRGLYALFVVPSDEASPERSLTPIGSDSFY